MKNLKNTDELNKVHQENIFATTPFFASSKLNIKIQYYVIYYFKKLFNFVTNKKIK